MKYSAKGIKESFKRSVCDCIDTMDVDDFTMTITPDSFVENVIKVRFDIELRTLVVDEEGDIKND